MEAKTLARQKYRNDIREEMRRSFTSSKEMPSNGIVRHFTCKEATHLGNIISRNI